MNSNMEENTRVRKLLKLFTEVTKGQRTVNTPAHAKLFLEAVQCKTPPQQCVEILVSSSSALDAIRTSVRTDVSLEYIKTLTLPFLDYISDPDVKLLADGLLLQQLLATILQPPTLWNALISLFLSHQFPEDSLRSFAWLVFEVVSLPPRLGIDLFKDVQVVVENKGLLEATALETRELGYKIQKAVQMQTALGDITAGIESAEGRHDNDFADFRRIEIFPTSDELNSKAKPFYRHANEVFESDLEERAGVHLDNQYRLLREDMLVELREDFQRTIKNEKARQGAYKLGKLSPIWLDPGEVHKPKRCLLSLECCSGLETLQKMELPARKEYLKKNRSFLKHQTFGALCRGDTIYGFAFVERDIDLLSQSPSVIRLRFTDSKVLARCLVGLKSFNNFQFVVVDTPVFAYQPVLERLKDIRNLPLEEQLIDPTSVCSEFKPAPAIQSLVSELKLDRLAEHGTVYIDEKITLDHSQGSSLLNAFTKPLSVIQGPPGTGKSFIGSQIIKYLHQRTNQKFMVISYTNHALDQFLEDLQGIGIPDDDMVRLGSKSTTKTMPLLMSNQNKCFRRSRNSALLNGALKRARQGLGDQLELAWNNYMEFSHSFHGIMEYLEFSEDFVQFYESFKIPEESGQWKTIGRTGKAIEADYLYHRWINGQDAGVLSNKVTDSAVWKMDVVDRQRLQSNWFKAIMTERVEAIQNIVHELDDNLESLHRLYEEQEVEILNRKRVIGCTTTAAAMYSKRIRGANRDVVLVEEAGEILECHVLTALPPTVKQLVLIGDHKQLRPKIKNYELSVEKGLGYDFNRSLFERLILQGHPHTTLLKQHRMHPAISAFPRALTYPDLQDTEKAAHRPTIDGVRDRVIFVHHENLETGIDELVDRGDSSSTTSKQNIFEADMILKIVAYLSQQGYKTDMMTVLTPYLGQLKLLREKLIKDNNPILNDLDAYELIRAGLMTQAAAKADKRPLRLSTIDNYQGEESDIIVASLTRSNSKGIIGFMSAPERLNVLLSRARCCIIMIGNMNTFKNTQKGKDTWTLFFKLLKERGHLYDGLPVFCSRHPEKEAILQVPLDFEKHCPNGGCSEPCKETMACGMHKCPLRCHRISDHSKSLCQVTVEQTCQRKHQIKIPCSEKDETCHKCLREDKEIERRLKLDLELERKRLERQETYLKEKQKVDDKIDYHQRQIQYMKEAEDEEKEIAQKHKDAKNLQARAKMMQEAKAKADNQAADDTNLQKKQQRSSSKTIGPAEENWQWLKMNTGANIEALDDLMEMIGLEDVKQEFLGIKNKVDTLLEQNVSLKTERFNSIMLGNPGTGKTTVARLYSKFLCSVGVIPGSGLKETTGSALAHGGVSECKKLIDELLNSGGGVLFIDEAYQLTSGNNPGGGAVLDYLLPEVENLRGKVVFVLAGYDKEMETVFAHNPGIPSRFPIEMKFHDYSDEELRIILETKLHEKFSGRMACEDGTGGLYCRIVSRRIGRGRDMPGFGNARAIENALSQIIRRQSDRFFKERRAGSKPNHNLLTKEDLIGPEPSSALETSEPWRKLKVMIGLESVKTAVKSLVESIQQNYIRELDEQPPIEYSLNKVFLGNPGTGKTTVAKLYGGILVDLGLLSKGEGDVLGASEKQTKGILAASTGKVLVIDEAYGLYDGGGQGSSADPFKTAVINTIVAEVQNAPGDDRCVLLLGYRDQIERMFQNVNPGLSRRFPVASAFIFEDFNQTELSQIFDLKLKNQGFAITDQAKVVALEVLDRARNRPNFGNGGEIDIILNVAKARHQSRFSQGEAKSVSILEALDFDENYDRADRSETNVKKLFEGTVGCDDIVDRLENYQETVRIMRSMNLDAKESIPFNFLFRGPPGTGKTTTARKMGKVFYDMGFLASATVEDCSASDLVAQFVGQTGPKVRQLLDKSLGRVLFIDEAYRLADGNFAKEALDELTDCITKPLYAKKLIIILAGYEKDINRLISMNPGLTSRFPEVIDFRHLTPAECVTLLRQKLKKQKKDPEKNNATITLDISSLETPSMMFEERMEQQFSVLSKQSNWASGRDVGTIAGRVFNRALKSPESVVQGKLAITEIFVDTELSVMIRERQSRSNLNWSAAATDVAESASPPDMHLTIQTTRAAHSTTDINQDTLTPEEYAVDSQPQILSSFENANDAERDAGVSDEVWEQLQKDKQAEREREQDFVQLQKAKDTASAEMRETILKKLLAEEDRRKQEEEMRKKLEQMGYCPMGFRWIKQANGFRCAGGAHFVDNTQLSTAT